MTFKASIKPIKSLRIDLSADRNLMENRTSNLGIGDDNMFDTFKQPVQWVFLVLLLFRGRRLFGQAL